MTRFVTQSTIEGSGNTNMFMPTRDNTALLGGGVQTYSIGHTDGSQTVVRGSGPPGSVATTEINFWSHTLKGGDVDFVVDDFRIRSPTTFDLTLNSGDPAAMHALLFGGDDTIFGSAAGNLLSGLGGGDAMAGGGGGDTLDGGAGADYLRGNVGADSLQGGDGNDAILGGQQDDRLNGGAGDDYLSGDRGDDILTGGGGADTFHIGGEVGIDRITDFNRAQGDRLLLDPGLAYTLSESEIGVVLGLGGQGTIVLQGVSLSSLTGDWIAFG